MRSLHSFVLILLSLLLLAACGGAAETPLPTPEALQATPEAATDIPPDASPPATIEPSPRAIVTLEEPLPVPGTLLAPATEDPDMGLVFDQITLVQTSGADTLTIEIFSDGRVVRNGVSGTISQEQIAQLDAMLDQLNFFGLQGVFTAPGGGQDIVRYSITVDRAGGSRTIRAQQGYIPPELQALFDAVLAVAQPLATATP